MKHCPCIAAIIALVATASAVICKLSAAAPRGVSPRGMLVFAGVMLLFGINHSLCKQCMKGE